MAKSLYLEDGSTEYIFAGETAQDKLQKIIRERLGRDCEELYEEIIADLRDEDGDDYERIADGFRTMAALHEVLMQPRLSRKRLETIYNDLNRNL